MRNDYGIRSDVRFSKGGKVSKKGKMSKSSMKSVKKNEQEEIIL
jgi:hypothetical protein